MKILPLLFIIISVAIFACNGFSNKKTPLYKIPEVPKSTLPTTLQTQFNKGIDFIAYGDSIASWKLEMNFDDSIRFQAQNGLNFTIPAIRPIINNDSNLIYTSAISLGKVVITISKGNCNNTQFLNETLARQCSIRIANISYTGCGQFLYDSQVEGKWKLQQYKAVSINETLFTNGIPYLHFNVLNQKLSGFDGCNSVSGLAEIQGKRIAFGNLATTKKFCTNNPLPNLFSILDNQLPLYKIIDNLLYLYLIDDSVLIFKKSN